MNSKTMNIVLMVIIALILVVTVVIAVMTFSNHTPQPLPMHNEENVEANVTVENTIKNEIVEQPENSGGHNFETYENERPCAVRNVCGIDRGRRFFMEVGE